MTKELATLLFNECRDWMTLQEMMTEKEYADFLEMTKELKGTR